MCDWSLEMFASRPARVGERLVVHLFDGGTKGLISPSSPGVAVCLTPKTRLKICAVGGATTAYNPRLVVGAEVTFTKIDDGRKDTHHDAIMFDGACGATLFQALPTGLAFEPSWIPEPVLNDGTGHSHEEELQPAAA